MRLQSLQARFTLLVALAASVFVLFALPLTYELGYQRSLRNGSVAIGNLVDAFQNTAAAAAFTSDKTLLQEVVDGLGRDQLVAVAEITTSQGESARHNSRQRSSAAAGSVVIVERQLTSPFDTHEAIGTLRITADVERMKADARREALTLVVLMASQVALIAGLLYIAALKFVSRPIVTLARALRAMKPGTSERLSAPREHENDEIGMLIGSANELLQSNETALEHERDLREAVAAMEAQYRSIFDSTSAGIFVLDHHGRLINANPTVFKVIGSPARDVKELRSGDFITSFFARPDRVRDMMEQFLNTGKTASADLELLGANGMPGRWVHCLISGRNSSAGDGVEPEMIEGVIYDITERKRAEHVARHQADHDSLTDLKNRSASEAVIERFMTDARTNGTSVSVLYIDLDGFKRINDALGHQIGDYVLIQCARRMQAVVRRSSDLVGRLGGDEFVIALYNCGPNDDAANETASAVIESLCRPFVLDDGRQVRLGASIGIASYPLHGTTLRQIMHAADEAMYSVKSHGKNSFAIAAIDMMDNAHDETASTVF